MDEHINALAAQFGETGNTDYLLEYYTLYDNYDTLLKEYNDKYTQYEETKTAYRDALEAKRPACRINWYLLRWNYGKA